MPVTLRILLPTLTGLGPDTTGRVFGGSALDGYVAVSTSWKEDLAVENDAYLLEVIFEGELSNVISLVPAAVVLQRQKRLRFLRVTQTILVSGASIQQGSLIPFHFDIPNNVYGLDRDFYLGDREETLPPSLSLISDHVHTKNDMFVRGVCDISYRVRARMITRAGQYAGEASSHPVTFIPTNPSPLPPLCITDFGSEYALAALQKMDVFNFLQLQNSFELSIHTDEPSPLVFGRQKKTPFTTVRLRLRYRHTPTAQDSAHAVSRSPPPEMFFSVQSTLHAATFLSVAPQMSLPKQGDVEASTLLMKKTTVCESRARTLRFSGWKPVDQLDSNNYQWESNTALIFAYEGADLPAPTFACTYASRRYALSIQLRLESHRGTKFRLRVPVQITYCDPSAASPELATVEIPETRCMPPIYTE
ncbi:hypothetical protein FE257_000060 [Aspergillus nanangensis]|uniref:Uncharacterized protein n=1 Tax=Aspergillus nanangensis TaxID=2582783 RepID=A0AAD4D0F3_ASPNN|nr:hypothetical protein FE257_000060 [Aspergillus nanangensis]